MWAIQVLKESKISDDAYNDVTGQCDQKVRLFAILPFAKMKKIPIIFPKIAKEG